MSAVDPSSDPSSESPEEPEEPGPEEERRYPSTAGGAFYLIALAATVVGLCVVWTGSWRAGVRWIAGALVFAALVRLVLPRRDAGMLAVRHRMVDVLMLGLVGVVLFFLASTIPNQPF